MSFATTDLSDAHGDALQVADPGLRDYGGRLSFHGQVHTLKLFEDNSLVRSCLEQAGQGRILVVDGGASLRCALLGDQLGDLAVAHDWAGVVVWGCIRDSEAIGKLPIGVKALGVHPKKSVKKGVGQEAVTLRFAGLLIAPGDWLYADADGIVVSSTELSG